MPTNEAAPRWHSWRGWQCGCGRPHLAVAQQCPKCGRSRPAEPAPPPDLAQIEAEVWVQGLSGLRMDVLALLAHVRAPRVAPDLPPACPSCGHADGRAPVAGHWYRRSDTHVTCNKCRAVFPVTDLASLNLAALEDDVRSALIARVRELETAARAVVAVHDDLRAALDHHDHNELGDAMRALRVALKGTP